MSNNLSKGLKKLRERRQKNIKAQTKQIRKQCKIYSKVLNDFLWVVATEGEFREMLAEDPEMIVYTYNEISKLDESISKDALRKIHNIKKTFPGSQIDSIRDKL